MTARPDQRGPYRLGLTGGIAMGKSTSAKLFAEAGVPVWDADAAVHRLYAAGGAGGAALAALVPAAVGADGAVDRAVLRDAIASDPDLLARIEAVIHPLVAADRNTFLGSHSDADLVVFDIPLLFETGAEAALDGVVTVSVPAAVQRARLATRGGLDGEALDAILSRQLADTERRTRSDFVIQSDRGVEAARGDVLDLVARIAGSTKEAPTDA